MTTINQVKSVINLLVERRAYFRQHLTDMIYQNADDIDIMDIEYKIDNLNTAINILTEYLYGTNNFYF